MNKVKVALLCLAMAAFGGQAMAGTHGTQSKKISHGNIASKVKPANKAKPSNKAKPIVQDKPVMQDKPIVQSKPVVQEKPVVQDKPLMQEKPVVQDKPVVQEKPIMQNKPIEHDKPTEQERPVEQYYSYSHDSEDRRDVRPTTSVPEPGSLALLGAGILGIAALRRFNK